MEHLKWSNGKSILKSKAGMLRRGVWHHIHVTCQARSSSSASSSRSSGTSSNSALNSTASAGAPPGSKSNSPAAGNTSPVPQSQCQVGGQEALDNSSGTKLQGCQAHVDADGCRQCVSRHIFGQTKMVTRKFPKPTFPANLEAVHKLRYVTVSQPSVFLRANREKPQSA